jgi:hypothetical protein
MLITQIHIDQLMQQSLIVARADDPVIPERPRRAKRRISRKLILTLKRPATATAVPVHARASTISSSTTTTPRSVTS